MRDESPLGKDSDEVVSVIICDDHKAVGRGLAMILETASPRLKIVGVAFQAEDAVALVGELEPDVVLMDIYLARESGIEATRLIKERSPKTQVVMLTMSDIEADLFSALKAGASGYLTKDKDADEIIEALFSILSGHLVIPADLAERFLKHFESMDPWSLTEAERSVLVGVAEGKTNKEIARVLGLNERTVRRKIEAVYSKLHLSGRRSAVLFVSEGGLGKPGPNIDRASPKKLPASED